MTSEATCDPRRAVKDVIIQHDSFHRMLDRMERLWRDAQAQIPLVATFVGETGTGKTTAIETFARRHPRRRTPDGLVTPVLSVITPSKPTPRALAERILAKLGDPRPTIGSASAKLDRIVINLERSNVRVVVLDDFHHFVDKRQQVALFDASDYLKELLTSSNVALLCFGLPGLELVIESNEQLMTRCKAAFALERFDWMNRHSQDQFVGVLAAFQKAISGYELPDLASPEVSLRMYLATGGLIRYVASILSTAVNNAHDAGVTKIHMRDIEAAWSEEVVGANGEYPSPFVRTYLRGNLTEKVAKARTIAQRTERPKPFRHRKPKAVLAEIGL